MTMKDLNTIDLMVVNGGGPIADAVEWFLCALINAEGGDNYYDPTYLHMHGL